MSAVPRRVQSHEGPGRAYARAMIALQTLAPKPADLIQNYVRKLRAECARYRTENNRLRARLEEMGAGDE